MIRIESHSDYQDVKAAYDKLAQQAQKNQQLVNEKLHKLSNAPQAKRMKFETLKSQNEITAKSIEKYFDELISALSKTNRSLIFVRDGKFQDEVDVFVIQLELTEMRLQAETEGGVEYFDIYRCGNRWHVSEASSQESIADFPTQAEAEAYAVKLRRRFRILKVLSED